MLSPIKDEIRVLKDEIARYILGQKSAHKRIFATSSFQTQSAALLHILSQIDKTIPIYFLNTGYHFPETLSYKKHLTNLFNLNVTDLRPSICKSQQKNAKGELLYASDPDQCCYYNKVQPLESIIGKYDIWISGIRKEQTDTRKFMKKEMRVAQGIIRYHPLLECSSELIQRYLKGYKLPEHPLASFSEDKNISIGCEPCTQFNEQFLSECVRSERWAGLKKTECGLHTRLGLEK